MTSFSLDPSVLPGIPERKGTLNLRSDHMKYGRATLNSHWHKAREAEPKDYDVTTTSGKRDLLKATYARIGSVDGGFPETTTVEAMNEAHRLKDDFQTRQTHKLPVTVDNFTKSLTPRETGTPERGYGSILPRHSSDHAIHHLKTTHGTDYQYHGDWSPREDDGESQSDPPVSYHHCLSEFTDTADHRRAGINTWQDTAGATRSYPQLTSENQ